MPDFPNENAPPAGNGRGAESAGFGGPLANSITPTSAARVFEFEHAAPVRIVVLSGAPWFVAADVCNALGLDVTAIRKLDADEKGLHSMQTPGGDQPVSIINESGLYAMTLRCRGATKPGSPAHRFRKWVTCDVLPALRTSGTYSIAPRAHPALPDFTDPAAAARAWADQHEAKVQAETRALALEQQVTEQAATLAELAPKAVALERFADHDGRHSTRDAAKMLGIPERKLIAWLLAQGWYYRNGRGRLAARAPRIKAGHLDSMPVDIRRADGVETVAQPVITQKGLARLGVLLADGLIAARGAE